jgi:transcriptional regulator with XRE-family HTH domain
MATASEDVAEDVEVDVLPGGRDEPVGANYQVRLGTRLRAVRRAQGLRLQDVEERSEGRFKAVVVGSYERGDRAVSAHKLAALASFYEVSVAELLPEDEWPRTRLREGTLAVDVQQLRERSDDPELAPLLRLVQHVQWLRDDYSGQVLSLRTDDLRTIAVSMGAATDRLDAWLDERGLLHH